ncbi:MAG: sugar ABC transporter ATP-binding protein [Firmicutes bacterium]|nr:sugar ABC transporter ATP-binding protein [Bacillota bacterium]
MRGITKSFFGNTVLKGVDIAVDAGEIHALVGENGAGKSTLMNILFGMPTIHHTGGFEGNILVDGEITQIESPADAMELGIGMVHQEFMLMPGFTVTENIKLNRELSRSNVLSKIVGNRLELLDMEQMGKDSRQALDRLGVDIDHWLPVAGLPVGYMQFVEIAREIDKSKVRVLVFDEPTAVLTESEAELFLQAVKRLAEAGLAILFISHRLAEVVEVAHQVTVLRDGEIVGRLSGEATKVDKIAEMMVGRKISRPVLPPRKREPNEEDIILDINDLVVDMPGERLRGLNLAVRRGEIIGLGGLAGHGKVAVANGIMGLYPAAGTVLKDGEELPLNEPEVALSQGLAFVSEDRRGTGLLLDESIEDNIVFTSQQIQNKFLRKRLPWPAMYVRDAEAIRQHALQSIEELDIRCQGPEQAVRRLSGGNQQKVCLGRALTLSPEILFASEPTRGIDIGAKSLVLDLLVDFNRQFGMTVVITSSELAELRMICDRIAIIYQGRLVGILGPDDSDTEYGLMMAGGKRAEVG